MTRFIVVFFTIISLSINCFAKDNSSSYKVNLNNISMKEFITFAGSFLGKNIVYSEQDLRGNVTVKSQTAMSEKDIIKIFEATLTSNGLTAVNEGDYIKIIPDKDLLYYTDTFSSSEIDSDTDISGFNTTVILLNNYNAVALTAILSRVKSKVGNVEYLKGLNAILVRDTSTKINKMQDIAYYLDTNASEIKIFSSTFNNIPASRAEQHISKFFNDLLKNALASNIPIMISDDAANILVYAATDSDHLKINYIIEQLDSKSSNIFSPRVYRLKNANAADVEKVITKLLINSKNTQGRVSFNHSISSDKATNSLIAIGAQEFYNDLELMIEQLDLPRKQVFVEALILETSIDISNAFGVEWFGAGGNSNNVGFGSSINRGGIKNIIGGISSDKGPDLTSLPGGFSGGVLGDVIVYKGIKFPSISMFFNAVKKDIGINIVSNPQIMTLDNKQAEVFVGENRPYVTSEKFDSNNNPIKTYDYRDVGIRLKVTPHVSDNETINLEIEQEVNKMAGGQDGATTAPITLTRTTKTNVQLYDGSIMLIGGLMKDDTNIENRGVPFLSSIPLLGWLFKSTYSESGKTNLMIFFTTHIIHTREHMKELIEKRLKAAEEYDRSVSEDTSKGLNKNADTFIPLQKELYNDSKNLSDEFMDKDEDIIKRLEMY